MPQSLDSFTDFANVNLSVEMPDPNVSFIPKGKIDYFSPKNFNKTTRDNPELQKK